MKPHTVDKNAKPVEPQEEGMKYGDIRSEVEKPFNERVPMAIGRGLVMRTPRKHHLTDEEKMKLFNEAEKMGMGCVNPFRGRAGLYFGQVEALIHLGVDEFHSFKTVRDKIEEVLMVEKTKDGRTAWDNAKNRKPKKNATAPQDISGRIKTNFKTLQRLPLKVDKNPYGIKLKQFGLCIDIEYRQNAFGIAIPWYRLNTNGLSIGESLHAEDLVDQGKLVIEPMTLNPFRRRGPNKAKSNNDTLKTSESGEGGSDKADPSMESMKSLLKLG